MIKASRRYLVRLICAVLVLLFAQPGLAQNEGASDSPPDVVLHKAKDRWGVDISGENQIGNLGERLKQDLVVCVTDGEGNPLRGVLVRFEYGYVPDRAEGHRLEPPEGRSGEHGLARTRVFLGSKQGLYRVMASTPEVASEPLEFQATAAKESWWFFLIGSVLGGLAIFIYGMERMSRGLQRIAGDRMRHILSMLTRNRVLGVLLGTGVTAVIQSSSATTVMLVGFVNAGLMSFLQTLGVILGADIGTTITAQLIAFKLTDFALFMVIAGFGIRFFSKKSLVRNIGLAMLGFGLVFFGIKIMSDTMHPLRTYQPFLDLMSMSSVETPLLGLAAGAVFTAIVQSSSATTGVVIALSMQGLITLDEAIPLVLGANIGTCATALLAGMGATREAKRVALAHIMFKVIGVAIALPLLLPLRDLVLLVSPHAAGGASSADVIAQYAPRQIANAHTIFNVGITLLFLPFLAIFAKFIKVILPPEPPGKVFGPKHLATQYLSLPSLALEQAKRETVRMAELARSLVDRCIHVITRRDRELVDQINKDDDKLDLLQGSITRYLASLSQVDLLEEQSKRKICLLRTVSKLEDIGDIVSRELTYLGTKAIDGVVQFSEEGLKQVVEFHGRIYATMEKIVIAISGADAQLAQELIDEKVAIIELEKELHWAHIARLDRGLKESFETSKIHLDLLTNLRRINSHVVDIAYALIDEKK